MARSWKIWRGRYYVIVNWFGNQTGMLTELNNQLFLKLTFQQMALWPRHNNYYYNIQ